MRKFVVIWKGSSQKLPQVPAMFVFLLEGLNYLKTFLSLAFQFQDLGG